MKTHRFPWRRGLSACLALLLYLSLLPTAALAAQTGSSDSSRTVFDALGFDTRAPEGYEQEEGITDTPFGKTFATLAEVDELFVLNSNSNHKDGKSDQDPSKSAVSLVGNGTATGGSLSDFFQSATSKDPNFSGDAMLAVEGNFSTDNNGLKKDVAILTYFSRYRTSDYYNYLHLYTADPVNNRYMGKGIKLSGAIGNNDDKPDNHFTDPYTPYNYLDLTVGDFDGDGIDEIAVYDGSFLTPAVTVWKLQDTADDGFLTAGNWKKAWTRDLPKTGGLVPNMVSLAAADIDKDGIDDLAISYGYYKHKGAAQASKAVVLMGADNSQMMTRSYELDLGTVYRAGLTAGDVDNDGRNELMVGGSSSTTDRDARYLAIYGWNGTGFDKLASQNVNPTDGSSGLSDKYYMSLPYMAANLTVGKFYGIGEGPCIYMDSIILRYGTGGIEVLDLADKHTNYFYGTDFEGVNDHLFYVEWSARAADFTGSGQEAVGVNRVPVWVDEKDRDNAHLFAYTAVNRETFKNQHLNILSFGGSGQSRTVSNVYHQYADPSYSGMIDGEAYMTPRAVPFCLPNTDDDTIVLQYTGKHYYTYADPEVLAVLASPPYYADLANGDDDSQMIESKTSYSASHGSGGGVSHANSFSVGAYTSWEQSFSILGVELAHAEAEAAINNSFTWETQESSSIEYEVEYATMAGMDSVVLYALPVETYVYEATMPGGAKQTMTVNLPYQPSVRTISLEEYAEIQAVYRDILPDVGAALTHTVGDPGSYAGSVGALPDDRSQTLVYDGDFAAVGQGSQNTISQSIAMTSEVENSFNYDLEVEAKAGAGVGGVTVGVTAGYSHGAGKVHVTTAGSSYSGEMNGLPTQAQQYGYGFNWKLVGFLYQGKYPVVTYLVNSVVQPPLLPENFGASEEDTTTEQIALEWDYPGSAAGFVLYRYFQSPSASGYYKIGTVEGGDYVEVIDGVKHYQFVDTGLSPDTGYQYRIQTIGLSQPNTSIPSEALNTYTKPETGVPQVAVSETALATYPDVTVSTEAYLVNASEFANALVYYQWQKQSGRNWADLKGETGAALTFQNPDMGVEGVYRCKVIALVGQNLVTAYSPEVTVSFAQRASAITDVTISGSTLTATVASRDSGTSVTPSGTVNFILRSSSAETVYTAEVGTDGKASVTVDPVAGIYKVTASYSGSKIFLPASYDPATPLFYTKGVSAGSSYVDVKDSYVYGETFNFEKYTVAADGSVTKSTLAPGAISWTLPSGAGTDVSPRFSAGRAGWVGTAKFTEDGTTYSVNIVPRAIEIVGLEDYTFAYHRDGSAGDLWGMISFSGLVDDWAETDGFVKSDDGKYPALELVIGDSAGIESSGHPTAPGAYTARFEKNSRQSSNVNYTLTCPTVKLTITGQTYPITAKVASGQETWGSVSVAYPENATSAAVGQTIVFKATPNPGYAVKYWSRCTDATGNSFTTIPNSEGLETLTMAQIRGDTDANGKQLNQGLYVRVVFEQKNSTLTVGALPGENAGTVTTDNKYFTNGKAFNPGAEITFTAVAKDGWHFAAWEYYVSGQPVVYGYEKTYTVTMPDASVELYARFERDSYALTLSEGLAAYDGNGAVIENLAAIPGDTNVTVKPAAGYELAEDAKWTVNGVELDPQPENGEYTFTIKANTSVSVGVTAQTFHVALSLDGVTGGTASLTGVGEDGKATAGTRVTFTAEAERGYTFGGWRDANGNIVSSSASYTFAVSGDVTLTPVFTEQEGKTFTVGDGITWAITKDGVAVETDAAKLYPGETLTLTADPGNGQMVKGWTVNGVYTAKSDKSLTFAYRELEADNSFAVTFQPVTYFTVTVRDRNLGISADGEYSSTSETNGVTVAKIGAGSTVTVTYSRSGSYVTKWLAKDTAGNTVKEYTTVSKTLVIEDLNKDLEVTVETASTDDLEFFEITGKDWGVCDVALSGTYEKTEDGKRLFAKGSSVTLTVSLKTDDPYYARAMWIEGVTFGDMELTEKDGIWTGTIENLQGDVEYSIEIERYPEIELNLNYVGAPYATSIYADKDGKVESLPTPTRDGYTFLGWFTQREGGERKTVNDVFPAYTVLYAHWKDNSAATYTVTFDANGGTLSGAATAETGTDGKLSALPGDPSRSGYTFNGWYTANPGGEKVTLETVFSGDTTVYAQWTKTSSGGDGGITPPATETYPVTLVKASGGSVSADAEAAAQGDTVTLTVKASSGYALESIQALDADGKALALTEKGSGVYTFTMPASEVTVTATFKAANGPFTDVAADGPYAEAIRWAVENGITKGKTETTFEPNATCTRAQAVTFLWRAAGCPEPETREMTFTDVKAGSHYEKAVLWAVENGITKGTSETTFSPDKTCTRAQIVAFLWRSQKSPAAEGANPFTDVKAGAYYEQAVLWAVANGITLGKTASTFDPNGGCTRAQIVTFLWRSQK